MTRQLGGGFQELSTAALEERIRLLEYRVAVLTEAVQVLRARLDGHPCSEATEMRECTG